MGDGEVRNARRSLEPAAARVAGSAESRYPPTGLRPEIARIVEALARAAVLREFRRNKGTDIQEK
jgi:hypothetical protein